MLVIPAVDVRNGKAVRLVQGRADQETVYDQNPIDAQVVQAATKWKRVGLKQFGMLPGEGLLTDMRAVRKDYFLDHDHSSYVDQWDWEKVITAKDRNLDYLKSTVRTLWKVIRGAGLHVQEHFPAL